jgi:hypothetical protein
MDDTIGAIAESETEIYGSTRNRREVTIIGKNWHESWGETACVWPYLLASSGGSPGWPVEFGLTVLSALSLST